MFLVKKKVHAGGVSVISLFSAYKHQNLNSMASMKTKGAVLAGCPSRKFHDWGQLNLHDTGLVLVQRTQKGFAAAMKSGLTNCTTTYECHRSYGLFGKTRAVPPAAVRSMTFVRCCQLQVLAADGPRPVSSHEDTLTRLEEDIYLMII